MSQEYVRALGSICTTWPAFAPVAKIPVSEGIAATMKVVRPGGGSVQMSFDEVPYMRKPVDLVASRQYAAICFVGPAQAGKTLALIDGTLCYALRYDPGDTLIVQMTQDKAREFSNPRLDRMIEASEHLAPLVVRNNIHDKHFRNGMVAKIAWPTRSSLASTSYRYPISTDYDRVPDDIEGEGDLFGMLLARAKTYMSRGKVIVESTPGRPLRDPNYRPASPHEAPPVGGILGIYNRGTRNRHYWQCPHCREHFMATPGLGLFRLPPEKQLVEDIRTIDIGAFARQYARVICPTCGSVITFDQRRAMNAGAQWLEEGLEVDSHGRISGNPRTSSIASFWMGGVAAAYQTWEGLIRSYMQGLLDYTLAGTEEALQTTTNLDQGMPYMSRHLAGEAEKAVDPKFRAVDYPRFIVPDWTRFVLAFVDVQAGRNARFVVQIHAVGPYQEEQLVDRFAIEWSARPGVGTEFAPIDPAGHPEDWDQITRMVVQATYRTSIEGKEIRVLRTAVDSAGEDGVTHNAYRWFRGLRDLGLASRVRLTKGDKTKQNWFHRETYVGFKAGTTGDIPLQLLNANKIKDVVAASLAKREAGPGYYHFPKPRTTDYPAGWVPESFFDELQAEVRNEDGTWTKVKRANEAFDACVGIKALEMILGVDRRGFWDAPPVWAQPLDRNSEVIDAQVRREQRAVDPVTPVQARSQATAARRSRPSGYMGS